MSVTREQLVNVIGSHQWDRYQLTPGLFAGPAELRAELEEVNADNGFTVDVQTDDAGRRWIRYEDVRLTDAEIDTVVAIATRESNE